MIEIDLTEQIFSDDRKAFRKEIINLFLEEEPGTGQGEYTSRYKYIVKVLPDERKIYLKRPANLNNGFDFTLNVENTNFNEGLEKRASTRPTHPNILDDLRNKKTEDKVLYDALKEQIDLIFECKKVERDDFSFRTGHSTQLILECIKWLFVEQDVTYWNYSGRNMLYEAINDI